jgi:hypothetical protein
MNSRALVLARASVMLIATVSFVHGDALAAPANQRRVAVTKALQLYGWSVPICVWPRRQSARPYCFTVQRLIQRYPFYGRYISEYVTEAAVAWEAANGPVGSSPGRILDKLVGSGIAIGCVPKGQNAGVITMGQAQGAGAPVLPGSSGQQSVCDTNVSGTTPGLDVTFGLLVGAAPTTPIVSLSSEGQALYQGFYDECVSRASTNPGSTMTQGTASTESEEEKKKREDADQKKKDADKAAKEAEERQKAADEALAKQQAADKKVQDLQAANAPSADIQAAIADAVQAAADAQDAQVKADTAKAAAANAKAASDQAQAALSDFYAQQTFDQSQDQIGNKFASTVLPALAAAGLSSLTSGGVLSPLDAGVLAGVVLGAGAEAAGGYAGALWGRYNSCADESCAMSCKAKARAQAVRAELNSYKRTPCNLNVTPLPDDDKCYDSPGGIFNPPQVTLAQVIAWMCDEKAKVDAVCKQLPPARGGMSFDPCQGPLVMCSPDGGGGSPGSGAPGGRGGVGPRPLPAKSAFLPKNNRGGDGDMWRVTATRPGGR